MIKLNDELLYELGLSALPVGARNAFLDHVYETLEMRVGLAIAEQMTSTQLDEFEQLVDADDDGGALLWLQTHMPSYPDVVSATFDALKAEISDNATAILAAWNA